MIVRASLRWMWLGWRCIGVWFWCRYLNNNEIADVDAGAFNDLSALTWLYVTAVNLSICPRVCSSLYVSTYQSSNLVFEIFKFPSYFFQTHLMSRSLHTTLGMSVPTTSPPLTAACSMVCLLSTVCKMATLPHPKRGPIRVDQ